MIAGLVLCLLLLLTLPFNVPGERCSPSRYTAPGDFTANHGRFLTGHEVSETAGVSSPTRCSVLCHTEPRCSAFSYWHLDKNCVLHGPREDELPTNLSTNALASYYKRAAVVPSDAIEISTTDTSSPLEATSPHLPVCSKYALNTDDYEFLDEIFPVDFFTLDFSVRIAAGAILELCRQDAEKNNDPVPVFAIDIGVSGNNKSVIRRSLNGNTVASEFTPGILNSNEFRQFWVSYEYGLVRFGRAGERQTAVLEFDGRGMVGSNIRRAAVTSAYQTKWDLHVLGDVCLSDR